MSYLKQLHPLSFWYVKYVPIRVLQKHNSPNKMTTELQLGITNILLARWQGIKRGLGPQLAFTIGRYIKRS